MNKRQTAIVQGKAASKEDKELVQAILGGEMKNAWQPTTPGRGRDERPQKKGRWNYRTQAFRENYSRIFENG